MKGLADEVQMTMLFFVISFVVCGVMGTSLADGVFLRGAAALVTIPFQFFLVLSQIIPSPLGPLGYFLGFSLFTLPWMTKTFGASAMNVSIASFVALIILTGGLGFL